MSRNGSAVSRTEPWRNGRLLAACTSLALGASMGIAHGQAAATRFPIANAPIIAAMQRKQIPVSGVQIRLAAPITSSVHDPALDIRSLTAGGQHGAQLLVGCHNSVECLPFYVSASWPVDVDTAKLALGPSREAEAKTDTRNRGSSADLDPLRAGSPATLLLDGGRVHVTLRVVCLETQEAGANIRVTTPDRRQQYVASVLAPGVLKGTF